MDTKKVLAGLIAATAVTAASASINPIVEKQQQQEKVMSNLLGGLTTVMSHPECTVKSTSK